MVKKYLNFLFTITLFLVLKTGFSTHIPGGYITYEYLGNDSYKVSLNLFRDCGGVNLTAGNQIVANSSCGQNINLSLYQSSTIEVSQLCPNLISQSTCSGGTYDGYEKITFEDSYQNNIHVHSEKKKRTTCSKLVIL